MTGQPEQVLTTDEDNYIMMTVDEIVDRLRAERDEYYETNKRLRAQRDQLLAAVKMCVGFFDPTVDSRMYAKLQAAIAAVEEKP